MTEIKVTEVNESTMRLSAEGREDEDVDNEHLGTRILEIMRDIHEATDRATEKGLTVEEGMAVEAFTATLLELKARHSSKEDFVATAVFKGAYALLLQETPRRVAEGTMEDFLQGYFPEEPVQHPPRTRARGIVECWEDDDAPDTDRRGGFVHPPDSE